jgi:hypothetical protein
MAFIHRVAALAVFTALAFAAEPKPAVTHQRPAAARSAGAAHLSDSQIEAAIREKLAKSKIGKDGFTIKVQGGVATWSGRTDVVQHKGAATRMAKSAGAVAVNNRIQISDAARQRAASNLEKGRRRVQVKRSDPRSETR